LDVQRAHPAFREARAARHIDVEAEIAAINRSGTACSRMRGADDRNEAIMGNSRKVTIDIVARGEVALKRIVLQETVRWRKFEN
jgi:hypothetical protein